ncbi:ABC transporter substrate-binding protein [Actinocatenispora rupis]|uniref:ABC transporter substrate-binding protein n=1 Tax=Actinocatenispora rupis TaxID=519421 RepID=UPI001941617A|nr:ABC transporter substrate-binding protein [Actinocatenispora rupis]
MLLLVVLTAAGCTTAPAAGPARDAGSSASRGPADPVPGARRGGTLVTVQTMDFLHLDPQRQYVTNSNAVDQLIVRTLTMLKNDPNTGREVLVGDLATDAGTDVDHDGRTWRYTLKTGVRYEDGTAVTAADVAYGVARSFAPELSDGPQYVQRWLTGRTDPSTAYAGPYHGGRAVPPGVTVSGRTITFHLASPHPDFPYAASLGTTAPLPRSRDHGAAAVDARPFSTGPYKVASYDRGKRLKLVRNRYWDPATDAVRHDYFDSFVTEIGPDGAAQTRRLVADRGTDRYAVSIDGVPPAMASTVLDDRALRSRQLTGFWPFVTYLNINTTRVTSRAVRQAVNYAVDKAAYVRATGGPARGEVATTLLSPTVLGYRRYDAYPTPGGRGDPAKARQLLGDARPALRYAYPDTAAGRAGARAVIASLRRAGFRITPAPLDPSDYYARISRPDNPYDLYPGSWGADWPTGSTVLPPLFSGTASTDGNSWTYLDERAVDDRIDAISAEPTARAAGDWADLDRDIMRQYAPCVPLAYVKTLSLTGSRVHGVFQSGTSGSPLFYDAWLG